MLDFLCVGLVWAKWLIDWDILRRFASTLVAFGDGEFLLCSTFCLLGVPENLLVEVGVATGSCLVNNGRGLESASKRDIDWALPNK